MKPEIKQRWLEALRSGEYEQGPFYLCEATDPDQPHFCCLGVLTDLYQKDMGANCLQEHRIEEDDGTGIFISYQDTDYYDVQYSSSLPDTVLDWAGLHEDFGKFGFLPVSIGHHSSLASLNDGSDFTFSEIANIIEEQL